MIIKTYKEDCTQMTDLEKYRQKKKTIEQSEKKISQKVMMITIGSWNSIAKGLIRATLRVSLNGIFSSSARV